jgi:hypothetical protein
MYSKPYGYTLASAVPLERKAMDLSNLAAKVITDKNGHPFLYTIIPALRSTDLTSGM